MTQTPEQFLESRILKFAALLNPDEADVVDRLKFCRLIHPLKYNLTAVSETHLHRRGIECDHGAQPHILDDLAKQREAAVAYGIVDLTHHKRRPALAEELQDDLERDVVRLRRSIAADEEIQLAVPVKKKILKVRIDLLRYVRRPAPPSPLW